MQMHGPHPSLGISHTTPHTSPGAPAPFLPGPLSQHSLPTLLEAKPAQAELRPSQSFSFWSLPSILDSAAVRLSFELSVSSFLSAGREPWPAVGDLSAAEERALTSGESLRSVFSFLFGA